MSIVVVLVVRYFVVPRYLDPIIDWDDPRGADVLFGLIITPFWFLFSVLAGMLSVNTSIWMSRFKRARFLSLVAVSGYIVTLYAVCSFIFAILWQTD